jgi:hypothetical protein
MQNNFRNHVYRKRRAVHKRWLFDRPISNLSIGCVGHRLSIWSIFVTAMVTVSLNFLLLDNSGHSLYYFRFQFAKQGKEINDKSFQNGKLDKLDNTKLEEHKLMQTPSACLSVCHCVGCWFSGDSCLVLQCVILGCSLWLVAVFSGAGC